MDLSQILVWIKGQNWAVVGLVVVGILNVIVAGAKAMGWTYLADECQKIENAIAAMIGVAKTSFLGAIQKKG